MREKRISLVMLDSDKQALERLAEAEGGLSQAPLLRRLVRNEAKKGRLWLVPAAGEQEPCVEGGVCYVR